MRAGGVDEAEAIDHGGSLAMARALFPEAPEPWVDLSTGISPHAYPFSPPAASAFSRLPEPSDLNELCRIAGAAYGAPSGAHVAAGPGTQLLLPAVFALVPPGRAAVLAPTYAEHARVARRVGHAVREAQEAEELAGADLAVVVNPNNPDGRRLTAAQVSEIARNVGLLVVDEAFMDATPEDSAAPEAERLVVLKSFGKFFGLAGLRLGFALCRPHYAAEIARALGPWSVSGPALAIGREALADGAWQAATRLRLEAATARLHGVLAGAGLRVAGGTALFRYVIDPAAEELFERLGRDGIFVRRFGGIPGALRVGLPAGEAAWSRLERALA